MKFPLEVYLHVYFVYIFNSFSSSHKNIVSAQSISKKTFLNKIYLFRNRCGNQKLIDNDCISYETVLQTHYDNTMFR